MGSPVQIVLAKKVSCSRHESGQAKEWITACAACGLGRKITVEGKMWDSCYDGPTLHDLRRSAVRNLINPGVRERVAMQITGHKTPSVFDRYHIASPVDVTNRCRLLKLRAWRRGTVSTVKIGEKAFTQYL
jgi:hypothetical protein